MFRLGIVSFAITVLSGVAMADCHQGTERVVHARFHTQAYHGRLAIAPRALSHQDVRASGTTYCVLPASDGPARVIHNGNSKVFFVFNSTTYDRGGDDAFIGVEVRRTRAGRRKANLHIEGDRWVNRPWTTDYRVSRRFEGNDLSRVAAAFSPTRTAAVGPAPLRPDSADQFTHDIRSTHGEVRSAEGVQRTLEHRGRMKYVQNKKQYNQETDVLWKSYRREGGQLLPSRYDSAVAFYIDVENSTRVRMRYFSSDNAVRERKYSVSLR